MTKEQKITLLSTINDTFSQYYSGHLHTTELEACMRAIVPLIESWEVPEPQLPTNSVGFNLSTDDLQKLLGECLKPEEISGEPAVQLARIKELINWFRRFADRSANAKWFHSHAFELAYYVASSAANRFIDLDAVREKGWLEGININPAERDLARRMGLITATPAPQAAAPVWVKISDKLSPESKMVHVRNIVTNRYYEGYTTVGIFKITGSFISPVLYHLYEWLDESPRQVFTREQVEAALNAGIGIGVLCHDPKMAQERGDEYMSTNYPQK